MSKSNNRLKMVPWAVAITVCSLSGGAFATPAVSYGPNITLDAQYSLNGGVSLDGMAAAADNFGIFANANGADLYLNKTDALANNVFFHTYGFSGSPSYFGARASGNGYFSAFTSTNYHNTYTNSSSTAQVFDFSFNVNDGGLGIDGAGVGLADLILRISKNGSVVAQDRTTLSLDGSGLTCSTDDVGTSGLGNYMGCSGNTVTGGAGGLFNVSMGLIAAGESFTLDYDIIATVSGNLTHGTSQELVCDGGYGDDVVDDGYGGDGGNCSLQDVNVPGMAIARSGDPFNGPAFNNEGVVSDSTPVSFAGTFRDANDVPEPGSLALVGLALAGLAASRKKKST